MGIGQVWGTAQELLHPRDRRGRFRKKWKMADSVAKKILGFLDGFSPRMFSNDAQAAQYLFNTPHTRFDGPDLARLHMDLDETNEHLRSGDIDESTRKFTQMMDRHKVPIRDDIIVSRTVGPEAFGLTPEQLGLEDGGIEDFTGKLIADRGYGAAHIGGIMGGQAPGNGKITMRVAVPKGTEMVIPARSRDDREIIFDHDQELRITKVQPDGAGGYYVLAVATPRTKGQTPNPISTSPRGVALTPEQREARVLERSFTRTPSQMQEAEAAQQRIGMAEEAAKRQPDLRPRQLEPTVRPQTSQELPTGVEPRNEPVPTPGAPAVPEAPAQAAPAVPDGQQFRQAVLDAQLPSPSRGNRRVAWNDAYMGIATGKRDPIDALRELDRDIETFKKVQAENDRTGIKDAELPGDIDALERLGDLIRQQFGAPQRETPTPKPEAPPVKKAAAGAKKAVSSQGGTKAAGLTPEQQRSVRDRVARMKSEGNFNPDNPEHQRLQSLVDQMAPTKKAVKAPAVKKAAPAKAAAPAVPEAAPESKKPTWGTIKSFGGKSGDIVMYHGNDRKKATEGRLVRIESRGGMYDLVDPETGKRVVSGGSAGRSWLAPAPSSPGTGAAKKAVPGVGRTPEQNREIAALTPSQQDQYQKEIKDGLTHDQAMGEIRREATHREREAARKTAPAKKAVPEVSAERPLEKHTVSELRQIASDENVELKSKMLKADIVKEIQHARTNKAAPLRPLEPGEEVTAADEAALLRRRAETLRTSGNIQEADRLDLQADQLLRPTKKAPAAKKVTPEAASRARRGELDRAGKVANAAAEIDSILDSEVSDAGLRNRIDSMVQRHDLPDDIRQKWLDSVGNRDQLRGLVEDYARSAGLTPVARAGEQVTFDPKKHRPIPGSGLREGQPAEVVHGGYQYTDASGKKVAVADTMVDAVTPGKKAVPEGSIPGPKAQTPISTPERRSGFRDAWNGAAIPEAHGSAGRSMREVRDDVSSGKITPEEGIRRMENDITDNKAELADMDARLRGDMSPAERRKLIADTEKLEESVTAQEKASAFMRDHFAKEAPVTQRELLKLEAPQEVHDAIKTVNPEDLKDEAVREGLDRPSGDTTDEVIQDIARQMAKRELASRATKAAKKTAPVKKAAPPKLPEEKGKLDARVLAEGLGIEKWDLDRPGGATYLDDVQRALDGERVADLPKNSTPAAIGRWLERSANTRRSAAAIRYGAQWAQDSPDMPPEIRAARQEQRAENEKNKLKMYAEADALSELAKRLQATRRPSVKKAAPVKKVAPAVKAAEARADVAERRIQQTALERLQAAKSESQAREALTGLTMPELRELGRQHGVTGRSKESIIKGLVDRHITPKPATESPSASTRGVSGNRVTGTPAEMVSQLQDYEFENPPSREDTAARLDGLTRTELRDMAVLLGIPKAKTLTAPNLKAEIVHATVGRRLDSIAIRGFRGRRPDSEPLTPIGSKETSPAPGISITQAEKQLREQGRTGTSLRQASAIRDEAAAALRQGEDPKMVARMIRDRIPEIRQAGPDDESGRLQITKADMPDIKRANISYMKALADAIEKLP